MGNRVVFLLILFVGATAAARADVTPVDLSSSSNDFKVVLNDPFCPSGYNCVDLKFTGTSPEFFPLLVLSADPFPTPVVPPQDINCSSDVFAGCSAVGSPPIWSFPEEFYGVLFYDGTLDPTKTYNIGVSGTTLALQLPDFLTCANPAQCQVVDGQTVVDLTPELPTYSLFVSGLLLLSGVAFWRRKRRLVLRYKSAIAVTEP